MFQKSHIKNTKATTIIFIAAFIQIFVTVILSQSVMTFCRN